MIEQETAVIGIGFCYFNLNMRNYGVIVDLGSNEDFGYAPYYRKDDRLFVGYTGSGDLQPFDWSKIVEQLTADDIVDGMINFITDSGSDPLDEETMQKFGFLREKLRSLEGQKREVTFTPNLFLRELFERNAKIYCGEN